MCVLTRIYNLSSDGLKISFLTRNNENVVLGKRYLVFATHLPEDFASRILYPPATDAFVSRYVIIIRIENFTAVDTIIILCGRVDR